MDDVEKAVGDWNRIYAHLTHARDRLRRAQRSGVAPGELTGEVMRLQELEERALRAVTRALTAARTPRMRAPGGTAWADTEPA